MSIQFYSDIPNDNWLRNKQSNANDTYHRHKGIVGSVTGSFGSSVKLPVMSIKHLPGLMDEHEYRYDPKSTKMKRLENSVEDSGKFDSKNNPIFITVNHRGEAFISEGNHRLAYAEKNGIQDIHAEVRYYNGGELNVSGVLHPDYIKHYNSQNITESINHPMIDVDGVQKHRHNSLGQPIHHTDEGIQNFHRWFGDSKAVDEHGRPLVVYHGTSHDFEEFKSGSGRSSGAAIFGKGMYFTDDIKTAQRWGYKSGRGYHIIPTYLSIKSPNLPKFGKFPKDSHEKGFDGVIADIDQDRKEFVVFHPSQIKSTIGNSGKYSVKSNKLTESVEVLSFQEFLEEGFDFKPEGHSEATTPKHPISEIIGSTRLNVAYKTAKKFNPSYKLDQEHPQSSLLKQYVIGKTMELAQAGSPEYKEAVFNGYKEHSPSSLGGSKSYDEFVNKSYNRLRKDTDRQFDALPVKLHFHDGEADYKSSGEMVKDVHHNRNLNVFRGGDPHSHDVTDPKSGLTFNQKFRAVHDFFGHAIHNTQFGPKGEEAAWHSHSQMFSDLSVPAATAETRGQNSQVNYTPLNLKNLKAMKHHGEQAEIAKKNGDSVAENIHREQVRTIGRSWNYAPQVGVVLPHEMNSPDFNGDVPKSVKSLLIDPHSKLSKTYDSNADHLGIVGLAQHYHPNDWHEVATKLAKIHGFTKVSLDTK